MRAFVKLLFIIPLLLSCAKEEKRSRMYIQLPEQNENLVNKVESQENASHSLFWTLPAPQSLNEVGCYGIMVAHSNVPEKQKFICRNTNEEEVARVDEIFGFYTAGSKVELLLDPGEEKTIFLVGLRKQQGESCESLPTEKGSIYSSPRIISKAVADLPPDSEITVYMEIDSNLGVDFEDCNAQYISDGNNSLPNVKISIADATLPENAANTKTIIQLSQSLPQQMTLTWTAVFGSENDSAEPSDLSITSADIVIPAGSNQFELPLSFIDDVFLENSEKFEIQLSNNSYGSFIDDKAQITILDDEAGQTTTLSLSSDTQTVNEGDSLSFTVNVNPPMESSFHLDYSVLLNGNAEANDIDASFGALTNRIITIPAQQSSITITIPTSTADGIYEGGSETFDLALNSVTNGAIISGLTNENTGTVTIIDDISSISLNVSPASSSISEASSPASFTVELDYPTESDIQFDWQTDISGAYSAEANDITEVVLTNGTIIAGNLSTSLSVVIQDDNIHEIADGGSETFAVLISNPSGMSNLSLSTDTAVMEINDDDLTPPMLVVNAAGGNINEGDINPGFNFTLTGGTTDVDISFQYSTKLSGFTADTADLDGGGVSFQTGTILAGNSGTTKDIAIANDSIYDPDETFGVVINSVDAPFNFSSTPASMIINDMTGQPTVQVTEDSPGDFTEGDAKTYSVELSHASSETISINYLVEYTGLADASDFSGATSGTLVFSSGGPLIQTVPIDTNNDAIYENDEDFKFKINNFVNATAGATTFITRSILNDDILEISMPANFTVNEADGSTYLRVSLNGQPPTNVTFEISSVNPGFEGDYYSYVSPGTYTIVPSETYFDVPITIISPNSGGTINAGFNLINATAGITIMDASTTITFEDSTD